MAFEEFRREVLKAKKAADLAARQIGGRNSGPWVLLATIGNGAGCNAVPIMHPPKRLFMRRFETVEEAIGASSQYPPMCVGGGWAFNLKTGKAKRIDPFRGKV